MEEKRAIGQLICCLINENVLSKEEEHQIKDCLEEKERKRRRCLAGIIESKIAQEVADGCMDETLKERLSPIVKKCFSNTKVGNMDASELSEIIVKEFIEGFSYLSRAEMTYFLGLLQVGLSSLADRKILNFIPDSNLLSKFVGSKGKINYIDNPYTLEETEKIISWANEHPVDVMGIALELFFRKGISLTEIVNLKKKDCWGDKRTEDSIMEFDDNLFKGSTRAKIIRKSLNMHPKEVDMVFDVPTSDGRGWKKLTEKGLQLKLYHICHELGIEHRKIGMKEAIRLDE